MLMPLALIFKLCMHPKSYLPTAYSETLVYRGAQGSGFSQATGPFSPTLDPQGQTGRPVSAHPPAAWHSLGSAASSSLQNKNKSLG